MSSPKRLIWVATVLALAVVRGALAVDALPTGAVWLEPATVQARQAQGEPLVLVDCRSRGEFQSRHLLGARSVSPAEAGAADLPRDRWLVLYCGGEGCGMSLHVARALLGRGYRQVAVLRGGLLAWTQAGLPTEGRGPLPGAASVAGQVVAISVREVQALQAGATGLYLADVRQASEYAAGHLPGAQLHANGDGLDAVTPGVAVVVYDRVGVQARAVAERIASARGGTVRYLQGGVAQWQRAGYPVVTK